MAELEKLKRLIDEENYPYFSDSELNKRIEEEPDLYVLARELCLIKSGIEEMKLGDVSIPTPREYFLMLARKYRKNQNKVMVRADEVS
jgi:hypothetical protein